MDRILAYRNEEGIKNMTTRLEWTKDKVQPYIEKYKTIDLVPELETADLVSLFMKPRNFFVEKLNDGEVFKIGKLTLSPEKVYDMMERPVGLDEFIISLEALNNYIVNRDWVDIYLGNLQHMELVNGQIIPKQSYINEQTELNSYYIETENQHAALVLMNEIKTKLNTLFALGDANKMIRPSVGESYADQIQGIFKGSGTGTERTYEVNLRSVLNGF
ncbi:hypothetical protein DRF62_18625 [Chryseobacterium piscium]|uniref:Uncharacterized protein n=1 Tax=Chryseobacterium piscium TaxID=333702 RepID=A0A3D9BB41_9FLAO|nr:hypothetical protein [Chryseobacterium piscium]REC50810.1 hypothetical protein DRF62_18625 [Chryseobacterium piscium]